jgi:hypothetical protein
VTDPDQYLDKPWPISTDGKIVSEHDPRKGFRVRPCTEKPGFWIEMWWLEIIRWTTIGKLAGESPPELDYRGDPEPDSYLYIPLDARDGLVNALFNATTDIRENDDD